MKNTLIITGVVLALLVGGTLWSRNLQSADPNVVSQNGLHWHPTLEMYVKGEKVEIPQGVGLGGTHRPMHTHDDLPIIHLEFSGIVRKDDLKLGQFFKNWDKDMRSFGTNMLPSDERGSTEASRLNVRMTVDGVPNTEYENYLMGDGDRIELRYE